VTQQNIDWWYNVKKVAKQLGVLVDENIPYIDVRKLYQTLLGFATSLTKQQALANNANALIRLATVLGVLPTLQATFIDETGSKWLLAGGFEVGINEDNGKAACQWLANLANQVYASAFGVQNNILAAAQELARSIPQKLYDRINSIKVIEKTLNVNEALKNLVFIAREINNAKAEFTKTPTYNYLIAINGKVISDIMRWLEGMRSNISQQYAGVDTNQMRPLGVDLTQLNEAYEVWAQKEDSKSQAIAEKIQTLIGIIEKYNDQPWIEMQDALRESPLGISEPTRESLKKSIQVIIDSARRA
jgi:hypothetical protein